MIWNINQDVAATLAVEVRDRSCVSVAEPNILGMVDVAGALHPSPAALHFPKYAAARLGLM